MSSTTFERWAVSGCFVAAVASLVLADSTSNWSFIAGPLVACVFVVGAARRARLATRQVVGWGLGAPVLWALCLPFGLLLIGLILLATYGRVLN